MLQVYGAVPPVACKVALYGWFRTAPGKTVVAMRTPPELPAPTVMLRAFVAVFFTESVTCRVNENVPDAVGVPEITPVEVFRDNPAGRDTPLTPHV